MESGKRYFTIEEANQRLPLVKGIIQDIVQLYADVEHRRERLEEVHRLRGDNKQDPESPYGEEVHGMQQQLERDVEQLETFHDELKALGAELKDPRTGLVDFLAKIDGREVYLCWKLGEDDIAWWHELSGGFNGRQSILEISGLQPDGDNEP